MKFIHVIFTSFLMIFSFATAKEFPRSLGTLVEDYSGHIHKEAVQICKDKGYRYYVVKSLTGEEKGGPSLQFPDMENLVEGELVQSDCSFIGLDGLEKQVNYEIIASNTKPEVPCVDLNEDEAFMRFIHKMTQNSFRPTETKVKEIVTKEDLDKEIEKTDKPIVIAFTSSHCGPCAYFDPLYQELSLKASLKYQFLKVDTSKSSELSGRYKITCTPMMILLDKEGNQVDRLYPYGSMALFFEDADETILQLDGAQSE